MGDFKHRIALAALAGTLLLSGCSADPGEDPQPAADTAPAQETTAPAEAAGPTPVAYETRASDGNPSNDQAYIASAFFWGLVGNSYGLSGQWTTDGNDPAHIAQLWENYFSDSLMEKLRAAEPGSDLTGVANWALLAVAPNDSSDPVKASAACKPGMATCWFLSNKDGRMSTVDNPIYAEAPAAGPNQFLSSYDVILPVSLTEQDNAEGYMSAVLKLNLTFVPNPTPDDGRAPYLIDSVNNELVDAKTDVLSNRPDLVFSDTM